MADTRELISRVERGIEASSRTSPTPPGRTEQGPPPPELVEAINQVFALFRLNYHNQYYAAFPDATQLAQIKKLWLESLRGIPVEQILRGARHAIEHSEYLPTLHRMLACCREQLVAAGLPEPREAYREACNAPSPKSAQAWSHPAVYLAGRDSDWFFLAGAPEREAFPVFREHYENYCTRVLRGERLEVPAPQALEQHSGTPLTPEQQQEALRRLRRETGL